MRSDCACRSLPATLGAGAIGPSNLRASPPSVQASASSIPPWKILPLRRDTYPLSLKCLGNVTQSGWAAPNQVRLSSTPVVVGYRPVSIDVRDGLQRGYWQ